MLDIPPEECVVGAKSNTNKVVSRQYSGFDIIRRFVDIFKKCGTSVHAPIAKEGRGVEEPANVVLIEYNASGRAILVHCYTIVDGSSSCWCALS